MCKNDPSFKIEKSNGVFFARLTFEESPALAVTPKVTHMPCNQSPRGRWGVIDMTERRFVVNKCHRLMDNSRVLEACAKRKLWLHRCDFFSK